MFPPQTSLIPATVAVERFVYENGGLQAFSKIYPYWYFGVPLRDLFGPIIPLIVALAKSVYPNFSFFDYSIMLIAFSFVLSALFWGILVNSLTKDKTLSWLVFFLLLFFPVRYIQAFALEETTFVIARNLTPISLIIVYKLLTSHNWPKYLAISVLSIAFLLLINTDIVLDFIIGSFSMIFAGGFNISRGRFNNIFRLTKRVLIAFLGGILVSSFWYGFPYWGRVLSNPSIGGNSLVIVITRLFDFIRFGLPLGLAIIVVYFSRNIKSRVSVFTTTWLVSFVTLGLFRYLSNPSFWTDWSSFLFETEIGVAILLSLIIHKVKKGEILLSLKKIGIMMFIVILSSIWIYSRLGSPILISQKIPQELNSLNKLWEISRGKKVFLSGTSVFWVDAIYNIPQLRGGVDQVIPDKQILMDSYELREGEDIEKSSNIFKRYKIEYVLVHTEDSSEFYHDFKNIQKWYKIGQVVWEDKGDMIFKLLH